MGLGDIIARLGAERGYRVTLSTNKGWFRETIRFEVEGRDLKAMRWAFYDVIADEPSIRLMGKR
jgi:hypothetical protein